MTRTGTKVENSTVIAFWSNGNNHGDLDYLRITLYRHRDGNHWLHQTGGAAMQTGEQRWIDRDAAVQFVVDHCTDPITGYGYSRDQAEAMVNGADAGDGRDDHNGRLTPDIYAW